MTMPEASLPQEKGLLCCGGSTVYALLEILAAPPAERRRQSPDGARDPLTPRFAGRYMQARSVLLLLGRYMQ
jgi:hypothetical protein